MGLKVILASLAGLSLFASTAAFSATINVPADQPTIQAGIDAAVNGDTVLVAPGMYTEALDFLGKDISVISSGGPEATVIERAEGQTAIARFASGESSTAMFAGFKLMGESSGFQVYIENSSPTIERNHFVEHAGTSQNNVCLRITGNSHPMVRRNLFYDNAACWGIVWSDADSINFINNTINSGVRGLIVYSSNSLLLNNIVVGCSSYGLWTDNEPMTRQYNAFWNNNPNYLGNLPPDPTDISADPLFANPSADDFTLAPGSPCIDAGHPDPQYDDPDGSRNDMGAIPFASPYGPVIFVSPTGSDSTGDGSESNPFGTIQYAIDLAWNGDTVRLSSGVYSGEGNYDLSTLGKSIVVLGTSDEDSSIVQIPSYGVGFRFENGEDSTTKIIGVTIKGTLSGGRGLHIDGASPHIIRCVVREHHQRYAGAGLYCVASDAVFDSCVFVTNTVGLLKGDYGHEITDGSVLGGAGAAILGGSPVFRGCSFAHNTPFGDFESDGGAISYSGPGLYLEGCSFDANNAGDWQSTSSGGAIFGGPVYATDCVFTGNSAGQNGGAVAGSGIYERCLFAQNSVEWGGGGAVSGDGLFIDCNFTGNTAGIGYQEYGGGGAAAGGGTYVNCEFRYNTANEGGDGGAFKGFGRFENCIFANNRAIGEGFPDSGRGGAVYGGGNFTNCTFVSNEAVETSAIVFTDSNSTLENCIIAFGQADDTANGCVFGYAEFNCTDIFGNSDGDWVGDIASQRNFDGNFSSDPLFCNAAAGSFAIDACSPCAPERNECGVLIGALDVGCSGYCGPVWHVATTGNDTTGDGSPSAPFATIQHAIDRSWHGDTVLLAAGTYIGVGNKDLSFDGKAIVITSSMGPDVTILALNSECQSGFSFKNGEVTTSVLSGIQFTAVGPLTNAYALVVDGENGPVQPRIRNCLFSNLYSTAIYGSTGGAVVENCIFDSNTSRCIVFEATEGPTAIVQGCEFRDNSGDCVSLWNYSPTDTVRIEDCIFQGNAGSCVSFGMSNLQASLKGCQFLDNEGNAFNMHDADNLYHVLIDDCVFENHNSSAISVSSGFGSVTVTNGVFRSNTATQGGAIRTTSDVVPDGLQVIDCLFERNSATKGGAIYAWQDYVVIEGCVFMNNAADSGGALYITGGSECYIRSSTFFGNVSEAGSLIASIMHPAYPVLSNIEIVNTLETFGEGGIVFDEESSLSINLTCSNLFGNSDGDWQGTISGQLGINGNISANPYFCDTTNGDFTLMDISPCAPANNSCSTQIGAFGVGCSGIPSAAEAQLLGEVASNVVSHTPAIGWQYSSPVEHAQDSFEVAIGTDTIWTHAEMWNPAPFAGSDTSVTYGGAALVDGSDYFGRLRVHNGYTWSPWAAFQFHMNSLPSVPVTLSPIGDAVVPTDMPTLWIANASDFEGDSLTYDFYGIRDTSTGWKDAAPIEGYGIAEGEDSTGFTVSAPLVDNSHYWWQVRAFDGYEYSEWTDLLVSSFWVNANSQAPSAPVCLTPPEPDAPSAIIYDLTPDFCWSQAYDSDPFDTVRYKLNVALDQNFVFSTLVDSFTDTCYSWTDSLEFGEQYWWRVSAHDRVGLSTPSTNVLTFWTWTLGDMNHDHQCDLSDLIFLVNYLFMGGPPVSPALTGDLNGDCLVDLSDLIYLVNYLFMGGPGPRVGC